MMAPLSLVLDTNVVSEMVRPEPDLRVTAWFDGLADGSFYLTATSLAELRIGLALMPVGRKQKYLSLGLERMLDYHFAGRVLPFDQQAAERYSVIMSRAQGLGRRIEMADGQIAAVASVHGFAVATRDLGPFEAAGLTVVNPWTERLR